MDGGKSGKGVRRRREGGTQAVLCIQDLLTLAQTQSEMRQLNRKQPTLLSKHCNGKSN